ncbi:MAG: response regulator transcription factor [Clostridia bacterium]|nr:response regulator transcription factor [Clostridia bacterium]MBQ8925387.1 response regulator transcription factor [Clostridia bacterium]
MTVFVLSNEPKTVRFLTGAVKTYGEQKYVDVETRVFRRMRDYLLEFDKPDLIFIDDNFEMKPSVENARVVRTKDGKAALVLLSTNPERVFEAFTVRTHRFLTKPVTQSDIFDALDSYRKELFADRVVIVKVDDAFRVFTSEDIYAVIADVNHTKIMTKDEMVETITKFTRIETQLPPEYFYKVHRSYVINMKHIAKFTSEQVEMTNHAIVPISRRKRLDFHMRYSEYVKGHTFRD